MKKFTILAVCLFFITAVVIPSSAVAADGKKKKSSKQKAVIAPNYDFDFDFSDLENQLQDYEKTLENMDVYLGDLDIKLKDLDDIRIYHSDELRELENLRVVVPDINIDIPPIPPIPEIAIHIPEFRFDGMDFTFSHDFEGHKLFKNLSDEEQIRLQALRSVARQDIGQAIPALEKIALEDPSPALRYEAVRQLGRFFEDQRVVPILGEVVKNDNSLTVRKKAIQLLGKSKDPRAVEILEEVVGN